jgi:predicted O-methyltransferase YrrM
MNLLNTKVILGLYEKYQNELLKTKSILQKFFENNFDNGFCAMLGDIEAELTYMFIRESRPSNVVEFSPNRGYSTMWILYTLNKNNKGKLFSFDLIDESTRFIPDNLKSRWTFNIGDVKKNLDKFPKKIDYLFIDSDHSKGFCRWYTENILDSLKDTYVSVHDIMKRHVSGNMVFGEANQILRWLDKNNIKNYSAGTPYNIGNFKTIDKNSRKTIDDYRVKNNLNEYVVTRSQKKNKVFDPEQIQNNSMIYFKL